MSVVSNYDMLIKYTTNMELLGIITLIVIVVYILALITFKIFHLLDNSTINLVFFIFGFILFVSSYLIVNIASEFLFVNSDSTLTEVHNTLNYIVRNDSISVEDKIEKVDEYLIEKRIAEDIDEYDKEGEVYTVKIGSLDYIFSLNYKLASDRTDAGVEIKSAYIHRGG